MLLSEQLQRSMTMDPSKHDFQVAQSYQDLKYLEIPLLLDTREKDKDSFVAFAFPLMPKLV